MEQNQLKPRPTSLIAALRRCGWFFATAAVLPTTIIICPTVLAAPDAAVENVEKGISKHRQGNYQAAREAFDAASKAAPDDLRVIFDQACSLAALGDFDNAEQMFRKSTLADDPKLAAASWYNLGWIASQRAQKALGETPENASVEQQTAGREQLQRAVQNYRSSLAMDPADPNTRHNIELLKLWKQQLEEQWKQQQQQARQKQQQQQQEQGQLERPQDGNQQEQDSSHRPPEQKSNDQKQRDDGKEGESQRQQSAAPNQPSQSGQDQQSSQDQQNKPPQPATTDPNQEQQEQSKQGKEGSPQEPQQKSAKDQSNSELPKSDDDKSKGDSSQSSSGESDQGSKQDNAEQGAAGKVGKEFDTTDVSKQKAEQLLRRAREREREYRKRQKLWNANGGSHVEKDW